jgi:hypothetical protein
MASYLTPTGSPVEFTWTSGSNRINATVELTGRGVTPASRLRYTAGRLKSVGVSLDKRELAIIEDMQRGQNLKYGCWLGLKAKASLPSFKLYIEVPAPRRFDAMAMIPENWRSAPAEISTRLDMIGLNTATGQKEFYFSAHKMLPKHLPSIMKPVNLSHRRELLIDAVEELWGWPAFKQLPGTQHGYSYSAHSAGPVFSLFLFAEDLFGDDTRLRKAVIHLGKKRGWNTTQYERLTQPSTTTQGMTHGICTISIMEAGDPIYSFGFPPPLKTNHEHIKGE